MPYSLSYISLITTPPAEQTLTAIREESIERNRASGLTGLLLWTQHHFCQFLQGEMAEVENTMQRIAGDSRHSEPLVILRTEYTEALFPDWSMATSHIEDPQIARQIANAYDNKLPDLTEIDAIVDLMQQFRLHKQPSAQAVSYTHLTLPTIPLV